MGRDRPTRVEGTPRGLGLYRRQGREGFFFIKNWSHLAKEFPGAFERNGQFDEWIKRADGTLVDNLKEAKAWCLRRSGELEQRKFGLTQTAIRYSSEDLEGIAQSVANVWVKAWQRGANLQQLNLDLWRVFMGGLRDASSIQVSAPDFKIFFELTSGDGLVSLHEEEQKLQRLIWDQGYKPPTDQVSLILMRFGSLVLEHIDKADARKEAGELQPPKPSQNQGSKTWEALLKAKENEVAAGTMKGITVAVERLRRWASETYFIKLPSSIDSEMALEYRTFLRSESSLKISSTRKELKFLSSIFSCGTKHKILPANPFLDLPRDRQSTLQNQLATKKTIDYNNVISREVGLDINRKMLSNGKGDKDPSYDVFLLQAMTGARIQEVAGLRGCDFVTRRVGETIYHCIRITAWEQRGHGALGTRGGLKTIASDRFVPLPSCGMKLWTRCADPKNLDAAFPQERPTTPRQGWGDRLKRRMRDKVKGFRTKSWRETIINNATNAGISYRAIEMLTGKTGDSSATQYTSDDLVVMQQAVEINAAALQIEKWLEKSVALENESKTMAKT
jgi:hypothetical protein